MPRYRKKPIEIEARQHRNDPDVRRALVDWIRENGGRAFLSNILGQVYIGTLEGEMTAEVGDWIIKGVAGEFYPCKPEIFEATYELVEAAQ